MLWSLRMVRRTKTVLRNLLYGLMAVWATLAIYYSNLPWGWARLALAAVFAAFGIWALWITPRRVARWAFGAAFAAVLFWFISIEPSDDRPWRPEVAVKPRAIIEGDIIRITGYRHFYFRTRDDFDVRYEEREVQLSHLTSVDLFISFWLPGPLGHTFVSFNFDNGPPVCISIETRPEVGESFQPIASMFKQFELFYVVGDERDVVRLRTNHRDENVFLYRILASPQRARNLFLVYMTRINELADRPEWYHLLSDSCTINIVRYANKAGRVGGFDVRHLINGMIDRYLYSVGLVDTSLPFDELRARSRITEIAKNAELNPEFSQRIREGLPGMNATPPDNAGENTKRAAN